MSLKKGIILLIIIILIPVFAVVGYIEYNLVKNSNTSAWDIINVVKVHTVSDYEVVDDNNNEQIVMVRYAGDFPDYLMQKGCVITEQMGLMYYMKTSSGKEFRMVMVKRASRAYSLYKVTGIDVNSIE